MTINDIESDLNAKIEALKITYGAGTTLSPTDNTTATDELAEILGTVNPNHKYPPVVKS